MAGIPKNMDKILFAEDFIVYVMLCYKGSFEYTKTAECYRNVVYNAFNETVRSAMNFLITDCFKKSLYRYHLLRIMGKLDQQNYKLLVNDLRRKCFSEGFEAKRFLYFCAELSNIAGIFYSFGDNEIPRIAIREIVRSLENYPMHTGAWGTVNVIAEELSKKPVDPEKLYQAQDIDVPENYENITLPYIGPESRRHGVDEAIEVNEVHEDNVQDDYHHVPSDGNV